MDFLGSKTLEHLAIAFSRECQARAAYEYAAKRAKKDGFIQLSNILELIAGQERSHGKNFKKALMGHSIEVATTVSPINDQSITDALSTLLACEQLESQTLYPTFAQTAFNEGFDPIGVLFKSIANAEHYHSRLLAPFLEDISNNTVFLKNEPVLWVCSKCGYTHTSKNALPKCPGCGHPQGYFEVTTVKLN